MRIKPAIKKGLQLAAASMASIALLMLLTSAVKHQNRTLCSGVVVQINYNDGQYFLDEVDAINAIWENGEAAVINLPLHTIDAQTIEKKLEHNSFINKAEVYSSLNGQLVLQIEQEKPLIRIINSSGVSYYLSETGKKIPVSDKFTPRVPVATGFLHSELLTKQDSSRRAQLLTLATALNSDPFWDAMIEQIHVDANGSFEMIPKLGSHKVIIGTVDEKALVQLAALQKMYRETLKNVGWEQYKSFDLRYENQIVGSQK